MTRYDLAYLALSPLAIPHILYRRCTQGKYRESLPGMFGRNWNVPHGAKWQRGCVWLHAVSVGECVAAKALAPKLRELFPDLPLLVTTVTETGQATAHRLFDQLADQITYYPADFSWVVERFLATYRPRMFVIMETELWPNAIELAARCGCLVVLANGRISEKSFASYQRLSYFFSRPLRCISAFCMQSREDASRIIAMGAPEERVFVTGNCKFDVQYTHPSPLRLAELRQMLGLREEHLVIIAGSTHAGEEEIMLDAFRVIQSKFPHTRLVIVPRHPERFDAVWQLLSSSRFRVRRVSTAEVVPHSDAAGGEIILVDKMGLLAELYALADVALVAGSFVPGIGGHNLLEAAVHGVPVVFGPHMDKQPELTRILSSHNGGIVADAQSLAQVLSELLENPIKREELGERVRAAALSQQGAAQRTIEIIERVVQAGICVLAGQKTGQTPH
jgi:3-deoxy-D-manno-octulosonic-acid transferase